MDKNFLTNLATVLQKKKKKNTASILGVTSYSPKMFFNEV